VVSSVLVPDAEYFHIFYTGEREMRAILSEELFHTRIELAGREQLRNAIEKNLKLYVVRQNLKIGFFTGRYVCLHCVPVRLLPSPARS